MTGERVLSKLYTYRTTVSKDTLLRPLTPFSGGRSSEIPPVRMARAKRETRKEVVDDYGHGGAPSSIYSPMLSAATISSKSVDIRSVFK